MPLCETAAHTDTLISLVFPLPWILFVMLPFARLLIVYSYGFDSLCLNSKFIYSVVELLIFAIVQPSMSRLKNEVIVSYLISALSPQAIFSELSCYALLPVFQII